MWPCWTFARRCWGVVLDGVWGEDMHTEGHRSTLWGVTFGVLSTNLCFPSSAPSCAFRSSSFATSFAIWEWSKEGAGDKPTHQTQPSAFPSTFNLSIPSAPDSTTSIHPLFPVSQQAEGHSLPLSSTSHFSYEHSYLSNANTPPHHSLTPTTSITIHSYLPIPIPTITCYMHQH